MNGYTAISRLVHVEGYKAFGLVLYYRNELFDLPNRSPYFPMSCPHKMVCIQGIAMQNTSEKGAGRGRFPPKEHADKASVLIGAKIRSWRGRSGFSQARLGEAVGLTYQQIQKYERGANRVSASTLFDIADALGVDVGHFYDGLIQPVPALPDGPQKNHGAAPSEKRIPTRPDPEAEDLLVLFQGIGSAKYRRQLLELARSFVEAAASAKSETGA
jgi:transcriptional regulator with XRE-family HTH domain